METPTTSFAAVAGPSTEHVDDSPHCAGGTSNPSLKPSPSLPSPSLQDSPAAETKSTSTMRSHDDPSDADPMPGPRLRSSRCKKAVGSERDRQKPLQLLDLPVDMLKDIVKEVTHTNDLTSLALTHSALHRLAVPHIYSRFDIVWPDSNPHSEPRSGVDALTYGLATLVMAEEVFGEAPDQQHHTAKISHFEPIRQGEVTETAIRRRRGNHYAQFTKKFSLGNGPPDWVQEYLITKEGGKMLGTLVALAVARMRALETFVWDMPTGILRDVWNSLASLGERRPGEQPCRLDKFWVRWHNNTTDPAHTLPTPPPPLIPPPAIQPNGTISGVALYPHALDRVDYPSFSQLPPLKSFSVLDIDEPSYLDEMAVLIGKSVGKLRELRVGIAPHAVNKSWATVWEGRDLLQVDYDYPTGGAVTIGEKRLGGIMGVLAGFVHDMRQPKHVDTDEDSPRQRRSSSKERVRLAVGGPTPPPSSDESMSAGSAAIEADANAGAAGVESGVSSSPVSPGSGNHETSSEEASADATPPPSDPTPTNPPHLLPEAPKPYSPTDAPILFKGSLRLDTLELERVPLSVPVLQRTLDWTQLTSLTLLNCPNHEQLWKTLRRDFGPVPRDKWSLPPPTTTKGNPPRDAHLAFPLKLRKLHTNTVSPPLLAFLKETLAPNSLEELFLQETRSYASTVTIETIYKSALRRHRGSLRKLLLDSSERTAEGTTIPSSNRWRRWMLTREVLAFVFSGKMTALREIGIVVDYRDWHFLLQSLPKIPHVRSLYVPALADHPHGVGVDVRELALQVVDIVALRPEVELCYLGIAGKCFEILDLNRGAGEGAGVRRGEPVPAHLGGSESGDEEDDGDEDEEEDDEEGDGDEGEGEDEEDDETDTESEGEDAGGLDVERGGVRLREILFYDDRVAVFKARHGRL